MEIEKFKQILEEAYNDNIFNFLGLISILYNIREVARIESSLNFIDKLKKICKENSIYYTLCLREETADAHPFDEKNRDLHKNIKHFKDEIKILKKNKYYMYISKSLEKCKKAKKADINHDTKQLGELLGYPKCCIEVHHKRELPKEIDINLAIFHDITNRGIKEEDTYSFYNNVLVPTYALLHHFPCKWNCEESIKIGMKNLQVLKEYDEEISKAYEESLKSHVYLTNKFVVSFNSEKNMLSKNNIKFLYGELPEYDEILIEDNKIAFRKGDTISSFEFKKISFE